MSATESVSARPEGASATAARTTAQPATPATRTPASASSALLGSAWFRVALGLGGALLAAAAIAWRALPETQVPLLAGHVFTDRELATLETTFAKQQLDDWQRTEDRRVLVPRGRRSEYLRAAADSGAFPQGLDSAHDDLARRSRFLESSDERAWRQRLAQQQDLSRLLSEMRGIEEATVQYDERPLPGFRREMRRRALVAVRAEQGRALAAAEVAAIRDTVAASFGGLDADEVTITDLNHPATWTGDSPLGGMATSDAEASSVGAVAVAHSPRHATRDEPATSDVPATTHQPTADLSSWKAQLQRQIARSLAHVPGVEFTLRLRPQLGARQHHTTSPSDFAPALPRPTTTTPRSTARPAVSVVLLHPELPTTRPRIIGTEVSPLDDFDVEEPTGCAACDMLVEVSLSDEACRILSPDGLTDRARGESLATAKVREQVLAALPASRRTGDRLVRVSLRHESALTDLKVAPRAKTAGATAAAVADAADHTRPRPSSPPEPANWTWWGLGVGSILGATLLLRPKRRARPRPGRRARERQAEEQRATDSAKSASAPPRTEHAAATGRGNNPAASSKPDPRELRRLLAEQIRARPERAAQIVAEWLPASTREPSRAPAANSGERRRK